MADPTADVLSSSARIVWQCLALSLADGLITMALLQFWKDFHSRRAFNREEFDRRFAGGDPGPPAPYPPAPYPPTYPPPPFREPENQAQIRRQLIDLAAGGDEEALFGLPIEKLAGQVNVAAGTVIENPIRYPGLLRLLSYGSNQGDLNLLLTVDPGTLRNAPQGPLTFDYADARTRVSHQIQRTIDALQLSASQRWTRYNQTLSLLISFVIGLLPIGLVLSFPGVAGLLRLTVFVPVSIGLSIIGGFLAPILRDLAANASQKD